MIHRRPLRSSKHLLEWDIMFVNRFRATWWSYSTKIRIDLLVVIVWNSRNCFRILKYEFFILLLYFLFSNFEFLLEIEVIRINSSSSRLKKVLLLQMLMLNSNHKCGLFNNSNILLSQLNARADLDIPLTLGKFYDIQLLSKYKCTQGYSWIYRRGPEYYTLLI